jgi:hypothetical protein
VVVEPGLIETTFGDVVADGLLKRSGGGAYARLSQAVAKTTRDTYGHGRGTDPSVIARVASKVVKARRPRTRYVAGKYAKPMIMMRSWLEAGHS